MGRKATVFATLMMLAFAIDQVQKMCCALYRALAFGHHAPVPHDTS